MAKQKIVVKVAVDNAKKSRKALKIVAGVSGVESASFVGSDKHQITLTGERIDPVELAKLLKKGVGHTELVSVGSAEETTTAAPASAAASQTPAVAPQVHYPHHYYYAVPYHICEGSYNNDPSCTIM